MHKSALLALVLVFPFFASAHVTVKPAEVGVGAWQTFNVSVPVEKDLPTTGIRLVIPAGLEAVTPNVKLGWSVNTMKSGEGAEAMVTEISWVGGAIPSGMRDDFFFSAHVPAAEGTLIWKAYQTYADGSVVSWDVVGAHEENDDEESEETSGPASETSIINDLKVSDAPVMMKEKIGGHNGVLVPLPFLCWIIISLVMSGIALILGIRSTISVHKD